MTRRAHGLFTRAGATRTFCLAATIASPAAAQRTWPEAVAKPELRVEVGKSLFRAFPTLDGTATVAFGSFSVNGALVAPLTRTLALSLELPVSHFGARLPSGAGSATQIGNPWIGVEATVHPGVIVEVGVRPGVTVASDRLMDTLAFANGIAADYDHYEAWRAGYSSARATVHAERQLGDRLFISGLAGASIARPTRHTDEEDSDTDLYLLYGARAGFRTSAATTSVAFLGRAYPSASGPNTERTVDQIAFDISANRGRVRPLAGARLYLDRLLRPRTPATFTVGVVIR